MLLSFVHDKAGDDEIIDLEFDEQQHAEREEDAIMLNLGKKTG